MNNLHALYTDGYQVFRLVKYFPPTPDTDSYYQLERNGQGARVWRQDFLTKWKVFNAHAAFADYLLYTDELLMDYRKEEDSGTVKHMMAWAKGRCLETGIILATPIKLERLEVYGVDIGHCSEYIT
jgi:hypothetical protein